MLIKIDSKNMGKGNYSWLHAVYHFSFANYYKQDNMNFGVLRVLNDDLIEPHTGFDTHSHENMEIITYVVQGVLTHEDSMQNSRNVLRGEIQYMSAGTGVYHSEYNHTDDRIRSLQIWIEPDHLNYLPNYGDYPFRWEDRFNTFLHMVSGDNGNAPVKIHQDVNIYALLLERDKELSFEVHSNRQAYLILIEGKAVINHLDLNERDALEIIEENIHIKALETTHLLIIEMNTNNSTN